MRSVVELPKGAITTSLMTPLIGGGAARTRVSLGGSGQEAGRAGMTRRPPSLHLRIRHLCSRVRPTYRRRTRSRRRHPHPTSSSLGSWRRRCRRGRAVACLKERQIGGQCSTAISDITPVKARIDTSHISAPPPIGEGRPRLARWWTWIAYSAAAWCFAYAILGALWAFGVPGFPFGPRNDPSAAATMFPSLEADLGAPVIAILGVLGGVTALVLARRQPRGEAGSLLVAFVWGLSAVLLLVVPDYRPLLAVAYAPIILIDAPFGWPPDVALADVFPWPVVNQLLSMAGGLALAGTAIVAGRRARGACIQCGRTEENGWTTRSAAVRWGRWATAVAVAIPLLYAATRYAWALGLPVGVSESFLREGQETGLWWAGAALATLAVGGALLTLGLVRPWGETLPGWIPFGRRSPRSARTRDCPGKHRDATRNDRRADVPATRPNGPILERLRVRAGRRMGRAGTGAAVADLGCVARRCRAGLSPSPTSSLQALRQDLADGSARPRMACGPVWRARCWNRAARVVGYPR